MCVNRLDTWTMVPYLTCMATTTAHKEQAMTRKNISIDDLTAAIEWLNSYDRSDEQDEMADSLIRVIRHLRDEIAAKYADDLKREAIADLKADGKMLTAAGRKQLNALCKAKGETFAANIVSEFDRGSLHYQVRCLVI